MYRRELCAASGVAFVGGCLRLRNNEDTGGPEDSGTTTNDEDVADGDEPTELSDESETENEPGRFPDDPAFRLEEAWTGPDRGTSVRMVGDRTLIAGKNTSRTTDTGDRITVGGVVSISPDGEVEWRRYKNRSFADAPLRRADGEIYAGESRVGSDTEPAIVVAMNDDGTERWRFEAEDPIYTLSPVLSSTIVAGTVGREDDSGAVYALDRETGEVRWEEQISGAFPTGLGAGLRTVYVKLWNELRAYGVEAGSEKWRIDARSRNLNDIRVVDETVYTSYNDEIQAHAAADGETMWTGEMFNPLSAPPVVTDGTVFAGSTDTGVYAFNAATGERRWRHQADAEPVGLSVDNGRVWVTTEQDAVFALSMDGEPLFRTEIEGEISTNTHATGSDRLVVTGVYGTIGYRLEEI